MPNYNKTRIACYMGYVVQAIVNNLIPLLFIIFQDSYGITFEMLGRLILINFITQLVVDMLTVRYVD
ncbi:MAG: MFS transporter, partial [Eubacteriales bacterium]|nr:MFS transporter [Eubacteriales bacterium]